MKNLRRAKVNRKVEGIGLIKKGRKVGEKKVVANATPKRVAVISRKGVGIKPGLKRLDI